MNNLASLQRRRSEVYDSINQYSYNILSDSEEIKDVLHACITHLGLLLDADQISAYVDEDLLDAYFTPGAKADLKQKEDQAKKDGKFIPKTGKIQGRDLKEICTWNSEQKEDCSGCGKSEDKKSSITKTSDNNDENADSVVQINEITTFALQNSQIMVGKDQIYIPLLQVPNDSEASNILTESTLPPTSPKQTTDKMTISLTDKSQHEICAYSMKNPGSQSSNKKNCSKEQKSLGVICIKKSGLSEDLSYDEVHAVRQLSVLASVGLKHVRLLKKLEISDAAGVIDGNVVEFLTQPSLEEVDRIFKLVDRWEGKSAEVQKLAEQKISNSVFPALTYTEDSLVPAAIKMIRFLLSDVQTVTEEHLQSDVTNKSIASFISAVKKGYRPVSYHNWRHAFNVAQAMFFFVSQTELKEVLSGEEKIALVIGSICHDLDHRGCNNKYQQNNDSELWKRYGTSTLERHHVNRTRQILTHADNCRFLPEGKLDEVVELVEHAIISTDLGLYFGRKGKITELVKSVVESGGYSKHDWSDPDSRGILRSLLMTASDIIAISKPWKVQYQVAEVIYEEFFYQGDLDKLDDKIPDPVGMFNRDERKDIPKFQIGFINFICLPVYEALDTIAPGANVVTKRVNDNKQKWQDLYDGKIQPPIELPKINKFGIYEFAKQ